MTFYVGKSHYNVITLKNVTYQNCLTKSHTGRRGHFPYFETKTKSKTYLREDTHSIIFILKGGHEVGKYRPL